MNAISQECFEGEYTACSFTAITYVNIFDLAKNFTYYFYSIPIQSLHCILYVSPDRCGRQLQRDWCTKAYNCVAVNLVSKSLNWICFGFVIYLCLFIFNGDKVCKEYSLSRLMPHIVAFHFQCLSPDGL